MKPPGFSMTQPSHQNSVSEIVTEVVALALPPSSLSTKQISSAGPGGVKYLFHIKDITTTLYMYIGACVTE